MEESKLDSTLPDRVSLQVLVDGQVAFESQGKWLFPLFELEDFLQKTPLDMSAAEIRDKVIGKAAALLILRLGVGRVHGVLMSDLAVAVLENAQVPFNFDQRVPRISCQTEEILATVEDLEEAYQILRQRAGRC